VCPDNYRETEGEKGDNKKLPMEVSEKLKIKKSYYGYKSKKIENNKEQKIILRLQVVV